MRRLLRTVAVVLTVALSVPAEAADVAGSESASGNRLAAEAREASHPRKKRGQHFEERSFPDIDGGIRRGQRWLQDHGLLLSLDVAFYDQYASRVREGGPNGATFAWQLFADYEIAKWKRYGDLHLTATFLGTVGVDYNPETHPLSQRVGSISVLNGNVYPDAGAVDEAYLHWVSPGSEFVLAAGKLDMSYFFDTNRVANDAYRQFTAYALENDLSIPFPLYGGVGVLGRWNPTRDLYVMLAASDASSSSGRVPWRTLISGDWWELLEVGVEVEAGALGEGNYRVTGWHSNSGPGNGWGVGLNVDQNLGLDWLIGFLRVGTGAPEQTTVRTTMSGGIALRAPFGRKRDESGFGASWSDPTGGGRSETFFEVYYRFGITRGLSISPGLQVVVHPTENPATDSSFVGLLRLLWSL